jgi:1-acyl-sn-glycerol-3-phosphate acyltransferase
MTDDLSSGFPPPVVNGAPVARVRPAPVVAQRKPAHPPPPDGAPVPATEPEPAREPELESAREPESEPALAPEPDGDAWDRRVAAGLSFLRRRLIGEYEVDEFGFDQELTDTVFHPFLRTLYHSWFRVETQGAENIPSTGSGLLVANHSGVVAVDALMLSVAVHDEHPAHRYLRLLGADLVFRMPILSELTRKAGGTLACTADAERLLRNDELVGVFPEGFKGTGKLYRDRYKLQRFGRGGFVSAALRTGTPIIPAAVIGAEEIYPMLANLKPLARLLGTPYFPITPTFPWLGPLGLIPLPSKWFIEFGEPIETAGLADQADDPLVIFNLADQVRETIQQMVDRLLKVREASASEGSGA